MKKYVLVLMWMVFSMHLAHAQNQSVNGHQSGEEEAILQVIDDFMITLTTNDIAKRAGLQTEDGMTYTAVKRPDGSWRIVSRPNSVFLNPSPDDSPETVEKYWDPVVMIRGPLAMVWNPFEFLVDGKTSHCGVNLMQMVKTDGQWKLANTMWTHEPAETCNALAPSHPDKVRP